MTASTYAFTINAIGTVEISHIAERALIHVVVASSGRDKAEVSSDVISTAKHIETLCSDLSPADDTPQAKAAAALAHWSKTGLSATSSVPYNSKARVPPRTYDAKITFDIRFQDFAAMGVFGAEISALPHVEVRNIQWMLTSQTAESFRSQLRKDAAKNALQKARDYCEVLGCSNIRPLEINEGRQDGFSTMSAPGSAGYRVSSVGFQTSNRTKQTARVSTGGRVPGVAPSRATSELDLEFTPQELRMHMEISVKFTADPLASGSGVGPLSAKRRRLDDEDGEEIGA